jgi:hypothetical protein
MGRALKGGGRIMVKEAVAKALASSWGKKITPDLWFQRTLSEQELVGYGIPAEVRFMELSARLRVKITPLKDGRYRLRLEFRG